VVITPVAGTRSPLAVVVVITPKAAAGDGKGALPFTGTPAGGAVTWGLWCLLGGLVLAATAGILARRRAAVSVRDLHD
jgi:hypothetical protein